MSNPAAPAAPASFTPTPTQTIRAVPSGLGKSTPMSSSEISEVYKASPAGPQLNVADDATFDLDGPAPSTTAPATQKTSTSKPTSEIEEVLAEESTTAPEAQKDPVFEIPTDESQETSVDPEKNEEPPQQQQTQQKPTARDYSKYDPDAVDILKKLPNSVFNKDADKINDLVKAKKELDDIKARGQVPPKFYHEHPDSYLLSPEYATTVENLQYANFEERSYEQSLIAIQSGQAWKELVGYDKNNNPIFKDHPAPTDGQMDIASKVRLEGQLAQLRGQKVQLTQGIQNIRANAAQTFKAAQAELNGTLDKLLPTVKADSYTKEERKFLSDVDRIIPKGYKGHPLSEGINRISVAFLRLNAYAQKLQNDLNALKSKGHIPTVTRKAPGTSSGKSAGPSEDVLADVVNSMMDGR